MWTSTLVILAIIATFTVSSEAGLAHAAVPAVAHAALAPAVAYTNAVPYNIPPYSDRVDIFNKALAIPVAAYAASPVLHATPLAAGVIPQPIAYAPAAVAAHGVLPYAAAVAPAAVAAHGVQPHAAAVAPDAVAHAAPLAAPLASGVVPPNILPAYTAALGHSLPAHAYAAPLLRR